MVSENQAGITDVTDSLPDGRSARVSLTSKWAKKSRKKRGGDSTNSPPAKRQGVRVVGGIDRAVLSLYVVWNEILFDQVCKIFDAAKEKMKAAESSSEILNLWGCSVELFATGNKRKGGGPYYHYVFRIDGITFFLAKRLAYRGTMPNLLIDVGSNACTVNGGRLGPIWRGLKLAIHDWGGRIEIAKPSRVDLCVDALGVPVSEFVTMYRNGWLICRARAGSEFTDEEGKALVASLQTASSVLREKLHREPTVGEAIGYIQKQIESGSGQGRAYRSGLRDTGLSVGKGNLIRIYDKKLEVQSDPIKMRLLVQERWGGELPEEVTRIEFQLNRDGLKARGVDTVEDFLAAEGSIAEYLVYQWAVFREAPDRKNRHLDRSPIAKLWQTVQQGFVNTFRARADESVRIGVSPEDAKRMLAGLRGQLTSYTARKHGKLGSPEELADALSAALHDVVDSLDWENLLLEHNQKADKIAAASARLNEFLAPEPWEAERERNRIVDSLMLQGF